MPYKRDDKWVAQVKINGKKVAQKLFAKKKDARSWERKKLKNYKERLQNNPEELELASTSLLDWANDYLEFAESTCQRKTFKEKESTFRRLFKAVPYTKSVNDLKPGEVLKHLREEAKKRSGNAANKDRKNLVAAWNWGTTYMDPPLPQVNPCKVHKMPEVRHPRYVPPEDDFWKIYEAAEGQDQVMLAAFLYTAARRGEIFRLKWDDVDFDKRQIRLWTRKRKGVYVYHWLPMVSELEEKLLWWSENCPVKDTPYVFICLDETEFAREYYGEPFTVRQHFMKRMCEKAEKKDKKTKKTKEGKKTEEADELKIKPFGFHSIRHLSASILYHKGYDIAVIQEILRHQSPYTTAKYLKSLGLKKTRSALEQGLVKKKTFKRDAIDNLLPA